MSLMVGARLGPYEIIAPLGVGGMRACGHAELRPMKAEARHRRQFALGWGPSASERSAGGHAEARPWNAAARHQRQFAAGVGPRRQ